MGLEMPRTTLPPGGHCAAHLEPTPHGAWRAPEPPVPQAPRPLPPACLHRDPAPSRGAPYLLLPQCAAVSTQLLSTRTPAQWNERPLKRETCQGCEPRAHGAPEASRSKAVAFGGNTASAAGERRWRSEQAAQGKGWLWGLSAATGRSRELGLRGAARNPGESGKCGRASCRNAMEVGEGKGRERGRRRGAGGGEKGDPAGRVWRGRDGAGGAATRGAGREG